MLKRRRFKQTSSFSERLMQNVVHLEAPLATLPPRPERELVISRIRQNETAAHINEWLKSPVLHPPQEASSLGK
jgi:hypothetical protein